MPRRKSTPHEKKSLMTHQSSVLAPEIAGHPEIVQEHREDAPMEWADVQDDLTASAGLSLLLVDGRQPPALVVSNNNSICHAFQSSPEHAGLCDPYCGDAHSRATSANATVHYKCHAGLECFTTPVQIAGRSNLAVIGGRAFVSGADYRALAERFRAGELNELLARDPFDNVIFAEPERLNLLASRLEKAARNFNVAHDPSSTAIQDRAHAKLRNAIDDLRKIPKPASVELSADIQSELQREVDRLRVELEYRSQLANSLKRFLERISSNDPSKTYDAILSHSKELLRSDRASLMIFDEASSELHLKSAVGLSVDKDEVTPLRTGEAIAGRVIESGQPLVVEDVAKLGRTPTPTSRNYRTQSFISYPITNRGRRLGVLNLTDKQNGAHFDDVDVSLLEIIGPQIAVALEKAEWQERATQYQLMSITDPLTGLLNRRYLEERLTEELNRSTRYNYPVSCLMIDIDDFKKYNDFNGHQAGDVALKITAHNLKSALRSADVACRYGGEEFCILLPQTSITEAGVIAERMRQRVAESDYPHGKTQPSGQVSISIGVSTFAKQINTAEKIISAADRALYRAKNQGKNRIEFYVENMTNARVGG